MVNIKLMLIWLGYEGLKEDFPYPAGL